MKEWQKKVIEGMKLIKEGCSEVKMWTDCNKCPFTEICDVLLRDQDDDFLRMVPEKWDIPNINSTDS